MAVFGRSQPHKPIIQRSASAAITVAALAAPTHIISVAGRTSREVRGTDYRATVTISRPSRTSLVPNRLPKQVNITSQALQRPFRIVLAPDRMYILITRPNRTSLVPPRLAPQIRINEQAQASALRPLLQVRRGAIFITRPSRTSLVPNRLAPQQLIVRQSKAAPFRFLKSGVTFSRPSLTGITFAAPPMRLLILSQADSSAARKTLMRPWLVVSRAIETLDIGPVSASHFTPAARQPIGSRRGRVWLLRAALPVISTATTKPIHIILTQVPQPYRQRPWSIMTRAGSSLDIGPSTPFRFVMAEWIPGNAARGKFLFRRTPQVVVIVPVATGSPVHLIQPERPQAYAFRPWVYTTRALETLDIALGTQPRFIAAARQPSAIRHHGLVSQTRSVTTFRRGTPFRFIKAAPLPLVIRRLGMFTTRPNRASLVPPRLAPQVHILGQAESRALWSLMHRNTALWQRTSILGVPFVPPVATHGHGKYRPEWTSALADVTNARGFGPEHDSALRDLRDAGI